MGPQPLPNDSIDDPEWAHRTGNVDMLEWAHRTGDVDMLEWAHSHRRVVLLIILNGPAEGDMSIFMNAPQMLPNSFSDSLEWPTPIVLSNPTWLPYNLNND